MSGPSSPMQVPGNWDVVAPSYAEHLWQWSPYADEALRELPVSSSDRVLDVASGPGTLAVRAASRGARVDATDFSAGMIEQLAARAASEGVTVSAQVMDAQALAFADGTFDAAFCLFAFFFFPDRARAFRELHRVLRPGGRALVVTWAPIDRRPLIKLAFDAMAEAMPEVPRPQKGDLQDVESCVREMSEAGFVDVSARTFSASARFDSPEHYMETVGQSVGPLAILKRMLDAATWSAACARMLEAVRKRIPDGAELSAEAIFTIGTR